MLASDVVLVSKSTKVNKKSESANMATQTYTEVKKEQTDADPSVSQYVSLNTQTQTFTKEEDTDRDPSIIFGTQTVTKTQKENTDNDAI